MKTTKTTEHSLPLPLTLRLLNAAGEVLSTVGLARVRLEMDPLLRAATRRTGLTDFGDPGFLDGLRVLLTSLERDADLNLLGRLSDQWIIINSLVNRLLLTEEQKRNPEIFDRPLIPPLIVIGLPRTGTTFLHNLLAQDPAHYAPRYWELYSPIPLPGRRDDRLRKAERELKVRKFLTTNLDQKHFTAADMPEEDLFTLGATFETWYFWEVTPVYGYLDWYLTRDHGQKYREYRAWLQVLQASHPGRRLVLKSPEHTDALSELLRAVPEARLVQLNRDPVKVFASFISLMRSTQRHFTNALDVSRNTEAHLNLLAETAKRNLSERDANPEAALNIRYDDLVADPEGAVERVYEHYGLEFTAAYKKNLSRYVEENPQGKHGAHCYSAAELGVDEEEVRARFTEYNERFGFAKSKAKGGDSTG